MLIVGEIRRLGQRHLTLRGRIHRICGLKWRYHPEFPLGYVKKFKARGVPEGQSLVEL